MESLRGGDKGIGFRAEEFILMGGPETTWNKHSMMIGLARYKANGLLKKRCQCVGRNFSDFISADEESAPPRGRLAGLKGDDELVHQRPFQPHLLDHK